MLCVLVGYFILPTLGVGKNPLVGKPAPPFDLPVIHGGDPGNRISLDAYRGKIVLLDFWATWCRPCRAQIPIIEGLARDYANQGVSVIGINTDDEEQRAAAFAKQESLSYPIVYDSGAVFHEYRGTGLPTLVIIDAAGNVATIRAGVSRRAELDEIIKQVRTR